MSPGDAVEDLRSIGSADQRSIRKALADLATLEDPRQRLIAYAGDLKNFWKLRVGDFRFVCEIRLDNGAVVLIIRVAHRSTVYDPRSVGKIKKR